jgi:hypothetical protein
MTKPAEDGEFGPRLTSLRETRRAMLAELRAARAALRALVARQYWLIQGLRSESEHLCQRES